MKPVTITVDYMRGGAEALGDTFAAALIERLGKRIANVEAFAWQQDRTKLFQVCKGFASGSPLRVESGYCWLENCLVLRPHEQR